MATARKIPKIPAKREVRKYHTRTDKPSLPNFLTGRLAAPATSEKKIMGITTIFSIAISTVPKGETTAVIRTSSSSP